MQGILHGDLTANNILLASLNGLREEIPPVEEEELGPLGPVVAKVPPHALTALNGASPDGIAAAAPSGAPTTAAAAPVPARSSACCACLDVSHSKAGKSPY